MAELILVNGIVPETKYSLDNEVVMGRDPSCTIPLDDRKISRRHARIFKEAGTETYKIQDLGSKNGTRVNGVEIGKKEYPINSGDRIKIGGTLLDFKSGPLGRQPSELSIAPAGSIIMVAEKPAGEKVKLKADKVDWAREDVDSHNAEALRRSNEHLKLLHRIASSLGSILERDELLGKICDTVLDMVPADHAVIMLFDTGKNELVPVLTRHREGDTADHEVLISRTILGEVVKNRLSILSENAMEDDRFEGGQSIIDQGVQSVMCTPLMYQGELLGLIYVDSLSDTGIFQKDHLELLTTISHQAAAAVRNAELLENIRRETEVRANIERYLPKNLADKIVAGEIEMHLGGHYRKVTVLFSDIVEFTPFTEKMDPEKLVSILNDYYSLMVDTIFRYEGSIDKFMGDAIMALWGAPLKTSFEELLAIHAALEMQSGLYLFNKKLINQGIPPLKMRIGINTGVAIAGNIGSEKRMEYTVIGDNVNLAQRIEGQAGPGQVFISEYTYREVEQFVRAFNVGKRKLKGKREEVTLYSVRGVFPNNKFSNYDDQRKEARMEVNIEASCLDEKTNKIFNVLINNINRGGSSLALEGNLFSHVALEEGTELTIQFMIDELPAKMMRGKGVVRRIAEAKEEYTDTFYRLGIEFTELSDTTREMFDMLWVGVE